MTRELDPVEQAVADALRSEFYDGVSTGEFDDAAIAAVDAMRAAITKSKGKHTDAYPGPCEGCRRRS